MSSGEGEERISVSRETLRTEVRLANAELELRLRAYITAELDQKADAATVSRLSSQVLEHSHAMALLERGELTDALKRTIGSLCGDELSARQQVGWSKRERVFAVCGVLFWLLSISVSIITLVTR